MLSIIVAVSISKKFSNLTFFIENYYKMCVAIIMTDPVVVFKNHNAESIKTWDLHITYKYGENEWHDPYIFETRGLRKHCDMHL